DGERRGVLHLDRRRIGMGEHKARHAVGQRRLADALRADDEKGMRHAIAAIGSQHALFGDVVAKQRGRRARMRRRVLVLFGLPAHEAKLVSRNSAVPLMGSNSRRSWETSPDRTAR